MGFRLKITEGKGAGKEFYFGQDVVRIGRLPDNDLVLYDTGVSRHHCELAQHNGVITLRDIGSANGTTLNGAVTPEGEVNDGDLIGVGPITFSFARTSGDAGDKRRLGAQALSRPEDASQRERLEQGKTTALGGVDLKELRALRRGQSGDFVAVSVSRTETGSFRAYGRPRRWSFGAMETSTRVALVLAVAVLAAAVALSAYFFSNRPREDRSAEMFSADGETALLKFGAGNVDVYTPDRANFRFDYKGGRIIVTYAAAGIDSDKEVQILANGQPAGYVEQSIKWTKGLQSEIPHELLSYGQNVITFDNTQNEQKTSAEEETWAITQLQIIQQALPAADPKMARAQYDLGKAAYDTRTVAPQNLYKAIQYFENAKLLLEAQDPKPPLYDEIEKARQVAQAELDMIFRQLTFSAQRELRTGGDRGQAATFLQDLLRYYPNPGDRRHKEIKEKLAEVSGNGR